jgi:hypothetical protein
MYEDSLTVIKFAYIFVTILMYKRQERSTARVLPVSHFLNVLGLIEIIRVCECYVTDQEIDGMAQ